jgi:hypothetical protein
MRGGPLYRAFASDSRDKLEDHHIDGHTTRPTRLTLEQR